MGDKYQRACGEVRIYCLLFFYKSINKMVYTVIQAREIELKSGTVDPSLASIEVM